MKTIIFFTIIGMIALFFIWLAIHPERSNTGHLVVLTALCILALTLFPFKTKKKLPKLQPPKRFWWQVRCNGFCTKRGVDMKFYNEKVASAYLCYLLDGIVGKGERFQ